MTTRATDSVSVKPGEVLKTLGKHLLVDGFHLVVDLDKSSGSRMFDSSTGKSYLDFYSMFASNPVGFNHPRLMTAEFEKKLLRAARQKPANSDVYSVEMAEFVETMDRFAIPKHLPHLFLVEGGALGIENALKAAFDWKVQKNFARGYTVERGTKIVHFKQAFHGRSGYTLSLTNTDPIKTQYFPKFDWPRIDNPKITFPMEGESLEAVVRAERLAVAQIERAFQDNPDDIAAILIEPIQGEGGDNHFRPEFFKELRRLADAHEAMFIVDEVQAGVGLTGKMWSHEHFGVTPDMLCFGKKLQMGGLMCSTRIDEVPNNVFRKSGRINSTWGGNLADMVRATAYLEIIQEEDLVGNAARMGEALLAGLHRIQAKHAGLVSNVRGRGLMCAFDIATTAQRDRVKSLGYDVGVLMLGCGERSMRFRPSLNVSRAEIDEGLEKIDQCLARV